MVIFFTECKNYMLRVNYTPGNYQNSSERKLALASYDMWLGHGLG